jgi:chromosome segregation ATPase
MKLTSFLLTGFLFLCPIAFCQQPQSDTQTMQALLQEIRQLRHDIQVAATAARRAQILIFRIHEQQVAVDTASSTLENTKNAVMQMQWQTENTKSQIQAAQERRDRSENEEEKRRCDEAIKQWQTTLAEAEPTEQELKSKEIEQEADCKAARAKLDQLECELDQLDRDLQETAVQANNR